MDELVEEGGRDRVRQRKAEGKKKGGKEERGWKPQRMGSVVATHAFPSHRHLHIGNNSAVRLKQLHNLAANKGSSVSFYAVQPHPRVPPP